MQGIHFDIISQINQRQRVAAFLHAILSSGIHCYNINILKVHPFLRLQCRTIQFLKRNLSGWQHTLSLSLFLSPSSI